MTHLESSTLQSFILVLIASCALSFSFSHHAAAQHTFGVPWTYDIHDHYFGPLNWGRLSPAYQLCLTGQQQSPLDIITSNNTGALILGVEDSIFVEAQGANQCSTPAVNVYNNNTLGPITFQYRPSNASKFDPLYNQTSHTGTTDDLINTGFTAQVNYETGSSIIVNNQQYGLVQFHVHSPSEHTVNHKDFSMELHLLHQNNVTKQFVVVAVFMETPYPFNAANTTVESLQALNSSLDVGENAFLKTVGINNIPEYPQAFDVHGLINVADILPNNGTGLDYWTYPGSLTIPPCTEQVQWFVVQQVITISENQRRDVVNRFGQHINRPTQPLNGRSIATYTHTGA